MKNDSCLDLEYVSYEYFAQNALGLIVIDEAHEIFNDHNQDVVQEFLVKILQDNQGKARILILSDENQSLSSCSTEFPIDVDETVELNTITR